MNKIFFALSLTILFISATKAELINSYKSTKYSHFYTIDTIDAINKAFIASELDYLENQFSNNNANKTLNNASRNYVFTIIGSMSSFNTNNLWDLNSMSPINNLYIHTNSLKRSKKSKLITYIKN